MKPIVTADTPDVFKLPGGTAKNDLPCRRGGGKVISFWHPTDDGELERLITDRRIIVWTWWPNVVGFKAEVGDDEFTEETAIVNHMREDDGTLVYYYEHTLSDEAATHLANGGKVKFTVDMDPICPVSISTFEEIDA